MTTLQKTIVTATVAVLAGAGIYEARQAAHLRDQLQKLQQQQAPLTQQVQTLRRVLDDTTNRLAIGADTGESDRNNSELLKLRGEVARFRADAASDAALLASAKQSSRRNSEIVAWTQLEGILSQMKQRLHLTAEQEASIRGIFKGDSPPRLDEHEADLKALLTADQQADFERFQQERKQDEKRLDAYQAGLYVMSEVQGLVGLSREQQDKAFSALWEYGQQKLIYDESKNQSYDSWEDLTRLKLNALKGVLTEEQMAIYQKHEEQMLELTQLRFRSAEQ